LPVRVDMNGRGGKDGRQTGERVELSH
jgi:hypothetical protein